MYINADQNNSSTGLTKSFKHIIIEFQSSFSYDFKIIIIYKKTLTQTRPQGKNKN